MEQLLQTGGIALPPRGLPPRTGDDDPVDYYYRPLSARLYRARLQLAGRLLGPGPFSALLEVGYGSGIFLPELARRTERLAAVDIHDEAARVRTMLLELEVEAELRRASVYELPFGDGEFDAVVCLSVLEHLTDLEGALDELRRVLVRGGVAVLGFPARNPATDAAFRLAGYDPRLLHPSGHGEILDAVRSHPDFTLAREGRIPWFAPLELAAYAGCRCVAT